MSLDHLEDSLKARLEEVNRRIDSWRDRSMGAYRQQIKLKISLERALANLHRKSHDAKSDVAAFDPKEKPKAKWYDSPQDLLKRRQIVLKNPGLSSKDLCKLFDTERIGLPEKWETKFGVTTWPEAYKDKKARASIQRIISTDRKEN